MKDEKQELVPLIETDGPAVMALFNHYITTGTAAFPEEPLPEAFYSRLRTMIGGYPALAVRGSDGMVGFGFLHAHHPLPTFARTAEISYFIAPEHTGCGIGARLLARLEELGRAQGIDTILAAISSANAGSIRFHVRHGFAECGRFRRVWRKRGRDLDVVWMQKFLGAGVVGA
ncbi:MAG TPA: N-acetyltransferase family protein [bacterium]|nr:N-acetyltransferase family protein [bacterium]